ncbi:MAG: hypothetical protein AVDCRST_MAG68-620, partial [uncultured Gemmatimonadetes bacterium]
VRTTAGRAGGAGEPHGAAGVPEVERRGGGGSGGGRGVRQLRRQGERRAAGRPYRARRRRHLRLQQRHRHPQLRVRAGAAGGGVLPGRGHEQHLRGHLHDAGAADPHGPPRPRGGAPRLLQGGHPRGQPHPGSHAQPELGEPRQQGGGADHGPHLRRPGRAGVQRRGPALQQHGPGAGVPDRGGQDRVGGSAPRGGHPRPAQPEDQGGQLLRAGRLRRLRRAGEHPGPRAAVHRGDAPRHQRPDDLL